jgi:hypothetical protein
MLVQVRQPNRRRRRRCGALRVQQLLHPWDAYVLLLRCKVALLVKALRERARGRLHFVGWNVFQFLHFVGLQQGVDAFVDTVMDVDEEPRRVWVYVVLL